jgi:hypothetical protein
MSLSCFSVLHLLLLLLVGLWDTFPVSTMHKQHTLLSLRSWLGTCPSTTSRLILLWVVFHTDNTAPSINNTA